MNTIYQIVFRSIISHAWQATGSQSPLLILLQCRQGNMGRHNTGQWVRATWRGITNSSKHVGPLLVLYLGILWMSLLGESFHAYPRLIRWDFSTVYWKRTLTSDYGGSLCIEVKKDGCLPLYQLVGGWLCRDPYFGFLYIFGGVCTVPGSVLRA